MQISGWKGLVLIIIFWTVNNYRISYFWLKYYAFPLYLPRILFKSQFINISININNKWNDVKLIKDSSELYRTSIWLHEPRYRWSVSNLQMIRHVLAEVQWLAVTLSSYKGGFGAALSGTLSVKSLTSDNGGVATCSLSPKPRSPPFNKDYGKKSSGYSQLLASWLAYKPLFLFINILKYLSYQKRPTKCHHGRFWKE